MKVFLDNLGDVHVRSPIKCNIVIKEDKVTLVAKFADGTMEYWTIYDYHRMVALPK